MLRLLHVRSEGGQRVETLLAPHALEDVLGRVGAFAQPVALPRRLPAAARGAGGGSGSAGSVAKSTQFRHAFQGPGSVVPVALRLEETGRPGRRVVRRPLSTPAFV